MAKSRSASIQHVQQAQGGDTTPLEEYQYQPVTQVNGFDLDMAEKDKPLKRFIIFKLVNNKKMGRVNLPAEADIYNPKTQKIERARLLLGVDSIWKSEQKDVTEEYLKHNRRSIIFENRMTRIDVLDAQGLEFMRASNSFTENPHRRAGGKYDFFEWNPQKQEAEAYAKELLEMEALTLAMNQPYAQVKKHALFLGVRFNDELGEPKTENGIRRDYQILAKRNPQRFKDTLDTKEVEVHFLVTRAMLETKIDVNGREKGMAYWAGGGRICKIPAGEMGNVRRYLVELALTNSDDGRTFLEQLQTRIT